MAPSNVHRSATGKGITIVWPISADSKGVTDNPLASSDGSNNTANGAEAIDIEVEISSVGKGVVVNSDAALASVVGHKKRGTNAINDKRGSSSGGTSSVKVGGASSGTRATTSPHRDRKLVRR